MTIHAVVFDVFGTLAEIRDRRAPFRQLLQWLEEEGRIPHPEDAASLMSRPLGLAAALEIFGGHPPFALLGRWGTDLQAELASIRLYPEAAAVLRALRDAGYRLGVCSNLALPYGQAVMPLLPLKPDLYAWSYEVGAVKPDPAMYAYVVQHLGCRPEEVLFVGDTWEADYLGPTRFGMRAVHVCRTPERPSPGLPIRSLREVLTLLDIPDDQAHGRQPGLRPPGSR